MITRQRLQVQAYVRFDKDSDFLSRVPLGSVHIQPDRIPLEAPTETPQEPFSVSSRQPHQAPWTQQRGHPAQHIEPLAMLTGGGNPKPLALLGPPHSQTGMQGETGFVLKNNGLLRTQRPELFLTPCGTFSLLRPSPEDTNNWPASGDTPVDASSTEPDGPSALSQTDASGEPPAWDHPSGLDLAPTPKATSLSALPTPHEAPVSNAKGVQALASASRTPLLRRSPCESRRSGFVASDPKPPRSTLAAALPIPAAERQSSFQCRPRGLSQPGPKGAAVLFPDVLKPMWAFSWSHTTMTELLCQ